MSAWSAIARLFSPKAAGQQITTSEALLSELLRGGSKTAAGFDIGPRNAATISAVAAAVSLISECVAMLPLPVYARLEAGGKERNPNHPAYNVLGVMANSWQNAFQWREMMQGHLMLWGRCHSVKNVVNGELRELLPIHPDRVDTKQDPKSYAIHYEVMAPGGTKIKLTQAQVFTVTDRTQDGINPVSRVGLAKETLGSAKAAEAFGGAFFGNSGQPAGVLSTEQKLTTEQMDLLRESWKKSHGGGNAFAVAVLDSGFKFAPTTSLLKDAQFIETRKFAISDVARIWRIPPHLLGDLEKATFTNIEQQSLEFVVYTLLPWLKRWESAINTQLIAPLRNSVHFAEFLVDGLLRGDQAARVAFYSAGLRDGWLNRDEVREMENRNPIPDGSGKTFTIAQSIFGGQPGAPANTPTPANSLMTTADLFIAVSKALQARNSPLTITEDR